jgi:hypothetical protein
MAIIRQVYSNITRLIWRDICIGDNTGGGTLPVLPWTPANITTGVWYDAADLTTITDAAGSVSQWDDKSGNGNHAIQPTGSLQPFYDSLNEEMDFDGDDIMQVTNDAFRDLQNFGVISVQRWISSTNGGNVSASYDGYSYGWKVSQFRDRPARYDYVTFSIKGTNGNNAYNPTPSSITTSQDFINSAYRINSNRTVIRGNGTQTYNSGTVDTGSINYSGSNQSAIGGRYNSTNGGGAGFELHGALKELIMVDGITEVDVVKLEGYLAWKWGLTSNLPIGHPYKSTPPTI